MQSQSPFLADFQTPDNPPTPISRHQSVFTATITWASPPATEKRIDDLPPYPATAIPAKV
ncbi:hypothetical protein BM1_08258 [Bipolaris maydis]|nr:hypothetical protein BM1_08258 [Bipolaris maydis]